MVASSCCSAWLRCSSGSLPGPAWPPTSESALGESSSNPGLQHLVYLNGTSRVIDVSSKASRAPMRFDCLHVTCDHPAGQASKDGACFECRERPCELLIAVLVKAQRLDVCKCSPNLRAGCHSLAALRFDQDRYQEFTRALSAFEASAILAGLPRRVVASYMKAVEAHRRSTRFRRHVNAAWRPVQIYQVLESWVAGGFAESRLRSRGPRGARERAARAAQPRRAAAARYHRAQSAARPSGSRFVGGARREPRPPGNRRSSRGRGTARSARRRRRRVARTVVPIAPPRSGASPAWV